MYRPNHNCKNKIYMVSSIYNYDKLDRLLKEKEEQYTIEVRPHISDEGVIIVDQRRNILDYMTI